MPPSTTSPKFAKFLQKPGNRDRSKSVSVAEDIQQAQSTSHTTTATTHSPPPSLSINPSSSTLRSSRKTAKFLGRGDRGAETDVPTEPVTIPRRTQRPVSDNSPSSPPTASSHPPSSSSSLFPPNSPASMSNRLSGWFAHTFSGSTTDLSLPALLSSHPHSHSPSPQPGGKSRSVLLTAAKSGKGHLDKAVRYLLDSDATPDRCTEPIWLLGVDHIGWEPPPPLPPPSAFSQSQGASARKSYDFRSSTSSLDSMHTSGSGGGAKDPGVHWPKGFYDDFTSKVWLTYRSHFTPIRDGRLGDLAGPCGIPTSLPGSVVSVGSRGYASDSSASNSSPTATLKKWNWGSVVGGEKGWTTDSGWGCMLRTGQSLLANALVHCHLGRDWRRPSEPQWTAQYAKYVQIVTWFLDTPSPDAPFSVHRMALAGKELGKDVGQWFGPSTAAGAIKALVQAFPESAMGVALGEDGSLYETDVYAASWTGRRRREGKEWGERPVLVLLGIRLGLDGVNPIYYDTIKLLYTFPQSVGIAGGRPSSSYYFVGSQADNLFYLDPHHARPTIPLRVPTMEENGSPLGLPVDDFSDEASEGGSGKGRRGKKGKDRERQGSVGSAGSRESSIRSHAPSPLRRLHPSETEMTLDELVGAGGAKREGTGTGTIYEHDVDANGLTRVQAHYVSAYSPAELKTFHCERVRKMPLSGLDPSMLLGFLVRDEREWRDLRERVSNLPRTIFSIQDERPSWGRDDDEDDIMGMESLSDPDEEARSQLDEDLDDEKLFAESRSSGGSREDTEEDAVDPITPGPGARFVIPEQQKEMDVNVNVVVEALDDTEEDDDEDWPTPAPSSSSSLPTPVHPPSPVPRKQKKKKVKEVPVPVPMVKFPGDPETGADGGGGGGGGGGGWVAERQRRQSINVVKMHSQRGKDGGRTQSGGVKGILTGD